MLNSHLRRARTLALLSLLVGVALPAIAQVPTQIPFQGLLLDAGGVEVNGSVDLDFEIFDALASGSSLWSESHLGVIAVDGVYSVDLGSVVPLTASVVSGGAVFLEISVDGETLTPRQQLLSVPFALRADSVGTASALFMTQLLEHVPFDGGAPGNLDPAEGTGDTDLDGIPNFADPDNDNDGILDADEVASGNDINLLSPAITNVLPNTLQSYSSNTITVTGLNLLTTSGVSLGPEALTPTNVTATTLEVSSLAETSAPTLAITVSISNGETAVSAPIPVEAVAPTIQNVEPAFTNVDEQTVLTITGTGFYAGTVVELAGQVLVPSTLSPTQIVATLEPVAIASNYQLDVVHPNTLRASTPFFVLGPGSNPKSVFLSNTFVDGLQGPISNYDAICQSDASTVVIPGVFRAWMSNSLAAASPSSPATTFSMTAAPYRLINGTIVADNWADLTDGTLDHPIDLNASGGTSSATLVWTGTLADGSADPTPGTTCDEWGEGSGTPNLATAGSTGETDTTWTQDGTIACSTSRRIYCFEQ